MDFLSGYFIFLFVYIIIFCTFGVYFFIKRIKTIDEVRKNNPNMRFSDAEREALHNLNKKYLPFIFTWIFSIGAINFIVNFGGFYDLMIEYYIYFVIGLSTLFATGMIFKTINTIDQEDEDKTDYEKNKMTKNKNFATYYLIVISSFIFVFSLVILSYLI